MASLTLKNVPDDLLDRLRAQARRERRSLNQEALYLLEQALGARPTRSQQVAAWRELAGRWESGHRAAEEVEEIYAARTRGRDVDL